LNYSADILFDHHSRFNPELLPKKYWGIHVVRDPRDLLVSSAFYHKTSSEKWLHIQNNNLNGKTYQEHINSLPNIEEIILFEIDNQGGCNIQDMLNWNYQQPQFLEFRFEDLISEKGADFFNRSLQQISLNDRDIDLLNILFANYSIGGAWVKKKHVRNPTPKQWKRYFTKSVEQKFNEKFPNAVQMLGYNEE
jgi:hypothetical protein